MEYYKEKLSAEKLKQCYDIATPRIKQYLEAEINQVLEKIGSDDEVLELGCGYGRVLPAIAAKVKSVTGIDISRSNIEYGKQFIGNIPNCRMIQMDAANLSFKSNSFDAVICIQNGISAFHTDQKKLISESIRVTRQGGTVLFSSYSENIWNDRLEWFQLQSKAGLIGEIDYEKTGNGIIVCKDGFSATTIRESRFIELTNDLKVDVKTVEVDESSLFCIMKLN